MILYKVSDESVVEVTSIRKNNGDSVKPETLTRDQLVSLGYYPVEYDAFFEFDSEFYTSTTEIEIRGSIAYYTQKISERPLDECKNYVKQLLKNKEKKSVEVEGIGEVDFNNQALVNVDGLIFLTSQAEEGTTVDFRLYDNTTKKITLDDLHKIKAALIKAGLGSYQERWALEAKLFALETVKEVVDFAKKNNLVKNDTPEAEIKEDAELPTQEVGNSK